ncbi:MAG: hypothetical protein DMG57_42140 [Acidobacteria bacterium]|nr:MAG: hypothetical protein DMG57_42140 [Acidobacteriota bacterium]
MNAIRQNASLSRADIVRMTGLSPSSVTFIVERLKREKMICDQGGGKSLAGRTAPVRSSPARRSENGCRRRYHLVWSLCRACGSDKPRRSQDPGAVESQLRAFF